MANIESLNHHVRNAWEQYAHQSFEDNDSVDQIVAIIEDLSSQVDPFAHLLRLMSECEVDRDSDRGRALGFVAVHLTDFAESLTIEKVINAANIILRDLDDYDLYHYQIEGVKDQLIAARSQNLAVVMEAGYRLYEILAAMKESSNKISNATYEGDVN